MSSDDDLKSALRQWAEAYMRTAWRQTGQFIRDKGLSHAQFSLMMTMHYRGEAKITDIAEMLGVSPAYASQMIDKMVQGGFLSRTEDPNDRRVNRVTLSPEGRTLTETAIDVRSGWIEVLAEAVAPEERETAARLLGQMSRAILPLGVRHEPKQHCKPDQGEA